MNLNFEKKKITLQTKGLSDNMTEDVFLFCFVFLTVCKTNTKQCSCLSQVQAKPLTGFNKPWICKVPFL